MSDYFPVLFAILFVLVAFIIAYHRGAIGLLASGAAAAGGIAVLFFVFNFLPRFLRSTLDLELGWRFNLGVAAALAFAAFLFLRIGLAIGFKRMFNAGSWFHRFVDGLPGGILSLGPSLVGVFILFTCVRAAGTVQELNYLDSLARDGIREMAAKIPPYPKSASWRNAIETLPFVAPVLDATDPFSNRVARNAACYVLARDGLAVRTHLLLRPATGKLGDSPKWPQLAEDPLVSDALKKLDRVALVTAPAVQALRTDAEIAGPLSHVVFEPVLEEFVRTLEPLPAPGSDAIPIPAPAS